MSKIFEYNALWEYQAGDSAVPDDPASLVVPTDDWLGPEPAPFGDVVGDIVEYPAATSWTAGTGLWLRRAITLDVASDILLSGTMDNHCYFFLDGFYVGAINPSGVQRTGLPPWNLIIPSYLATAGTHELAVLCQDEPSAPGSSTTYFFAEAEVLPPVFPLWPRAPMSEILEWLTDVIIAEDSTEDRAQMRLTPRQSLDMSFYVPPLYQQALKNLIWSNRARQWLVPFWPHVQHLGEVEAGEWSLTVPTNFVDFRASGLALIWQAPDAFQIVGVDQVPNATTITLNQPTQGYSDAYVMPLRRGFMPNDPVRRFDGRKVSVQTTFVIEENRQLTVSAPTQYQGNDIYFDVGLLDGDGLDESMTTSFDLLDEALGRVAYSTPWPHNRPRRPHKMLGDGLEEGWAIRRWLHRRAGRLRAFWQPSFEADLIPVSTGALTTTLNVRSDGYLLHAADRTHIAIETPSGWLAREITAAGPVSDDVVELTLNASLAIDASVIGRVSWLGLWRMDADRVEINWIGGQVCSATVPVLELQP